MLIFALVLASPALADDGDLVSIELLDTNSNGQIDVAEITVEYAVATAGQIAHATDEGTTIARFTVTDDTTGQPVTITGISFVSGDGTVAVFRLALDESDGDLSYDTSATAVDVAYDDAAGDLLIEEAGGANSVAVAAFSVVANDDGAGPATTLTTTTFEIVFSETVDYSTIADGDLEFENTASTGYVSIAAADLDPTSDADTYTVTVTDAFDVDETTATVRFSGAGVVDDLAPISNTQTAAVTIADGIAPTASLTVDLALGCSRDHVQRWCVEPCCCGRMERW